MRFFEFFESSLLRAKQLVAPLLPKKTAKSTDIDILRAAMLNADIEDPIKHPPIGSEQTEEQIAELGAQDQELDCDPNLLAGIKMRQQKPTIKAANKNKGISDNSNTDYIDIREIIAKIKRDMGSDRIRQQELANEHSQGQSSKGHFENATAAFVQMEHENNQRINFLEGIYNIWGTNISSSIEEGFGNGDAAWLANSFDVKCYNGVSSFHDIKYGHQFNTTREKIEHEDGNSEFSGREALQFALLASYNPVMIQRGITLGGSEQDMALMKAAIEIINKNKLPEHQLRIVGGDNITVTLEAQTKIHLALQEKYHEIAHGCGTRPEPAQQRYYSEDTPVRRVTSRAVPGQRAAA